MTINLQTGIRSDIAPPMPHLHSCACGWWSENDKYSLRWHANAHRCKAGQRAIYREDNPDFEGEAF